MADEYKYVKYESFDDGTIVRILLDRPEARNAQNRGLLVELDQAFLRAEADDQVRVVILGGTGPLFSAGHDMGSTAARLLIERVEGRREHAVRTTMTPRLVVRRSTSAPRS